MLISDKHEITVTSLRSMPRVVEETRPRHLVSFVPWRFMPETPPGIAPERHIKIPIDESVDRKRDGNIVLVNGIARFIAFAHAWDGDGGVVLHCFSGISRSTAAALCLLAERNPETPADVLAQRLRHASVTAHPSLPLVFLGDALLARGGDLVRAVEGLGVGVRAAEGRPFGLPARVAADWSAAPRDPGPDPDDPIDPMALFA
ncbi:MAG: hypothetical protein NW205_00085 [Hyphomicrobiaceae bacterium]|nr:hypothetical protein [Hyphomicrobiaceae bacterium]